MARKLNPQGLIDQKNYLFADHAKFEDKVEAAFRKVCTKHKIPVNISKEKVKSGGMLLGSSAEMIVIDANLTPFAVLGTTVFGNYLSVSLYFLVEDNFLNKAVSAGSMGGLQALAVQGKNLISVRSTYSFWNTTVACLEEALSELGFEEVNSGFLGIK